MNRKHTNAQTRATRRRLKSIMATLVPPRKTNILQPYNFRQDAADRTEQRKNGKKQGRSDQKEGRRLRVGRRRGEEEEGRTRKGTRQEAGNLGCMRCEGERRCHRPIGGRRQPAGEEEHGKWEAAGRARQEREGKFSTPPRHLQSLPPSTCTLNENKIFACVTRPEMKRQANSQRAELLE